MNSSFVDRMFSKINSNYYNKKFSITILYSKNCEKILEILYQEGYIANYFVNNKKTIDIFFKYTHNKPIFKKILKISKTHKQNVYLGVKDIQKQIFSFRLGLITTSKFGIITLDEALLRNIGGKFLCVVE